MSFLGGPECSTAGNPLTQFTKHVQDDKSLQRDRLVGRGPGGMQEGMRSRGMMGSQDKVILFLIYKKENKHKKLSVTDLICYLVHMIDDG